MPREVGNDSLNRLPDMLAGHGGTLPRSFRCAQPSVISIVVATFVGLIKAR